MKITIIKVVLFVVLAFASFNIFSQSYSIQSMYSIQSELPSEQSAAHFGIGYELDTWDGVNLPSDNFYYGDNVLRGPIINDPENPTVAPISGGLWFLLLIASGYGFFVYHRKQTKRVKL